MKLKYENRCQSMSFQSENANRVNLFDSTAGNGCFEFL